MNAQFERRIHELSRAMEQESRPEAKEKLAKELGGLAGVRATIWVNAASREDFEEIEVRFEKAVEAIQQAFSH